MTLIVELPEGGRQWLMSSAGFIEVGKSKPPEAMRPEKS